MAGVYDNEAEQYAKRRPTYPKEWFSMLSSLTPEHHRVWDAGTGSGQAALTIAEFYDEVIATDVCESLIEQAVKHPKIRYFHTPISISEEEMVAMLGGDNSVDLIISATAVHWFDLDFFYSVANRVLKKPNGIISLWSYYYDVKNFEYITDEIKTLVLPYMDKRTLYPMHGYKTLPFPFQTLKLKPDESGSATCPDGSGSDSCPIELEMEVEMNLSEYLGTIRTGSAFIKAKEKGVDLLSGEILGKIEREFGEDLNERKKLIFKAFMLVGKPKC
ncbi:hypothetical protein LUZ60_000413 [Juncus effusus]|nr:hypothetical protein LUZ60_000413 [Juncus effusus]